MSKIVKDFYVAAQIPAAMIDDKLVKFNRNPDIMKEFEYWICKGQYVSDSPLEVEGYTAKRLAELSPLISGEGAFNLLIELRENPSRALKRIERGFYKK